jgi:DNA modification methylase
MHRHALEQNQALSPPALRPGQRLAVIYRALSELKLDPKNPRRHDRRQIRQIARSIETFGFNVPILVDGQLNVIAGHGRLMAARELGYDELPTIDLGHLSEAQKLAFMIADNRLTEVSIWDDRLLAESLRDLATLDLDFSIETTGFHMGEIDLRIEGLAGKAGQEDPADALPNLVTGVPVGRCGDLWILGRHRLLCGNALDQQAYERVMDGEQAAVVFADPPYNLKVDGHVSGLGRTRHREFAMGSGEMDPDEFTAFLARACLLTTRHSVDGAINFICIDWRHTGELLSAARDVYTELKNICVWVKHNAGMGSLFRSQHEFVFVFKHGKGPHRNNVQLGQHGRHRSNVWSYRGANDFGRASDEGNLTRLHPTVKPVMMVQDAVLDCSGRGEIVLDPFLGSGTSLIAAERAGRRCFGLEIDTVYVDTIIRRWQAFTGDHARHAVTKRTFDDVASEREGSHDA